MARAKAFAMHDAHACQFLFDRVVDEIGEPGFGFRNGHTVKVDLGLDGILAARELAHCATPDRLTMKAHALGITGLHRVDVGFQSLLKSPFLICPGKSRFGFRLDFGRRDAFPGTKGLRSGHLAAEKVVVFFAQGSVLRLWCSVNIEYSERDASRQTSEPSLQV